MKETCPKAVSPTEGAEICGVSRSKFYELLGRDIPARKVGRRTIVLMSDIEAWLASLPDTRTSKAAA